MILQAGINLEIKDKNVQAVIDLDTGMIGFTEIKENETIEFHYYNSPKDFRIALFDKLEPILAQKCHSNFKVCIKSKAAELLSKHFFQNK